MYGIENIRIKCLSLFALHITREYGTASRQEGKSLLFVVDLLSFLLTPPIRISLVSPFPKESVSLNLDPDVTDDDDRHDCPSPTSLPLPPAQVSHSQFVSSSILSPCPRPPLPFFASPLPLPASRESLSALGRRERQYTRQYLVQVGKVENNVSTSVEVK